MKLQRIIFTAAIALSACGGPEQGETSDDALEVSAVATGPASILNPCLNVSPDRILSFGATKWDVSTNSGSLAYANADRLCKRFVVDVTLPSYNAQATVGIDRFQSDVLGPIATPALCELVAIDVSLYSRIDGGAWSYHGKKSYEGVWRSFGSYCSAEPIGWDGDFLDESINVPAVQTTTSRVFRVLTTGSAFGGNLPVITAGHITNTH